MVDLIRMRCLMRKIPRIYWRIEQARWRAERITPTISDMPHAQGISRKVEDGAIEIAEATAAYDEAVKELRTMQEELAPIIKSVDDPQERAVLYLRYIKGLRIDDISMAIDRCDRHTMRIIKSGENKITQMSPDVIACHDTQ